MATYGVTTAQVAAEVPALVPGGDFSASTTPAKTLVQTWIDTADAIVTLKVQQVAGVAPQTTDVAATLATRFIVAWALAWVMRTVYAGNDPAQVKAAADQYQLPADALLAQLDALGLQAAGAGETPSLVRGVDASLARDLVITDADLGGLAATTPATDRARRF